MNDKLIKKIADLAALHEKLAANLGIWPPQVATEKNLHAATGRLLRRIVIQFQISKRQDDALKAAELRADQAERRLIEGAILLRDVRIWGTPVDMERIDTFIASLGLSKKEDGLE